jgi:hypothetical protein
MDTQHALYTTFYRFDLNEGQNGGHIGVNDLQVGQIIKVTTKHGSSYLKTYNCTPNMPFILHFIDLSSLEVKMEVIMEVDDLQ